MSEDTAWESVEGIELAFTKADDDDATAQRYRQDENEDPSLWMWRVWGNGGGGTSGGRSMTPVVRSSQRQRGFKLKYGQHLEWRMTKPKRGVWKRKIPKKKKKGRLYYQTPPDFAVARENTTFFSSRAIMRPRLDKEETATKREGEREEARIILGGCENKPVDSRGSR